MPNSKRLFQGKFIKKIVSYAYYNSDVNSHNCSPFKIDV